MEKDYSKKYMYYKRKYLALQKQMGGQSGGGRGRYKQRGGAIGDISDDVKPWVTNMVGNKKPQTDKFAKDLLKWLNDDLIKTLNTKFGGEVVYLIAGSKLAEGMDADTKVKDSAGSGFVNTWPNDLAVVLNNIRKQVMSKFETKAPIVTAIDELKDQIWVKDGMLKNTEPTDVVTATPAAGEWPHALQLWLINLVKHVENKIKLDDLKGLVDELKKDREEITKIKIDSEKAVESIKKEIANAYEKMLKEGKLKDWKTANDKMIEMDKALEKMKGVEVTSESIEKLGKIVKMDEQMKVLYEAIRAALIMRIRRRRGGIYAPIMF